MSRQIVLDTETTGLSAKAGHRIIEIGCIELINRKITSNTYHQYIQPDREVDPGAQAVHGLSNEFLADKPRFAQIVTEFMDFINGSELIIHNADFDVGFINAELAALGGWQELTNYCEVTDSLAIARSCHPGQRNSLDALCKRYGIDNTKRTYHGALLDSELLASVYLAMTGGQIALSLSANVTDEQQHSKQEIKPISLPDGQQLTVLYADEHECRQHQQRLEAIAAASGDNCIWLEN